MRTRKTASAAAAAEAPPRPLRLEYLPANQLAEHPSNWRLHPPEQMQALDAVVDEVGWAGALLYNERTERLLDGHARRQLFADRGGEVPVLIGSWDEATEQKILAMFDAVGDLAETDQTRLRALSDTIRALVPRDGEARASRLLAALDASVQPKVTLPQPVTVPTVTLKPHPRNYREHPPDQIEHLMHSIAEHGFYRPLVVARDHTILVGHGAAMAAMRAGLTRVPVIRLPLDPNEPRALKLLAADNEIGHLALRDDRGLTDLLKDVMDATGDLRGTGFDRQMLAGLLYVTRPRSEIEHFDAAGEWASGGGTPYEAPAESPPTLIIRFPSEEKREEFVQKYNIEAERRESVFSAWWPPASRNDVRNLRWRERGQGLV